MAIQKLLFVDTNIWLDFYRARTEAGLSLLTHLEKVSDRLIVSYHLEMEYKRNRQAAILEGMQELKPPTNIPRPGLFSDAKAVKAMQSNLKAASDRVKGLKVKLRKVLSDPATHDPVYKACQRLFHAGTKLVLTRDDDFRHVIRRRAFRRFLHGCPPRKRSDVSIGDALNWEWMIECALRNNAELVIVSRDADYGVIFEDNAYVNDHLRQEFSERVSRKRKLLLYTKLSEALKHFAVPVTPEEEQEEEAIVKSGTRASLPRQQDPEIDVSQLLKELDEFVKNLPPATGG
ncbi:MAG: PIN domain-containing protein [Pseudomonadota bacterium]|nr:PIN domain-containing protein [Pseudomonadota bacterium]